MTSAAYLQHRASREQWREKQHEHGCWLCFVKTHWRGMHVHEIERRSRCKQPYQDCNYCYVCADCHDVVGRWPHARQLALKWDRDTDMRDQYTLAEFVAAWRAIGKRPCSYVTAGEVREFLGEIQ